jgi:RNA polymerase sigma factor for flagellar operon FliA
MPANPSAQPRHSPGLFPPAHLPPVDKTVPETELDDLGSSALAPEVVPNLARDTYLANLSAPGQSSDVASTPEEQALVLNTLPLVKTVVGRIAIVLPPHIHQEDLLSAGVMGLMDAARRYDPSKGMSFKNYAAMRVRGAILDELRRMDWVPRAIYRKARDFRKTQEALEQRLGREATEPELAREMGMSAAEFGSFLDSIRPASFVSLDDVRSRRDCDEDLTHAECIADPNGRTSLDASLDEERSSVLVETIQALKPMEQKVLAFYYYEGMRLREIAEVMGITISRVSQIHTLAIQRIRRRLETAKANGDIAG